MNYELGGGSGEVGCRVWGVGCRVWGRKPLSSLVVKIFSRRQLLSNQRAEYFGCICTSLICLSLSLSVNGNFKEPILNFNPGNNQGEMSVRSKAERRLG